jgi:hypothetical protein
MNPFITIFKTDLQKYPGAEIALPQFSQKIKEVNDVNVYISQNSTQLIEFICYLKDSDIPFSFFPNEEELIANFP